MRSVYEELKKSGAGTRLHKYYKDHHETPPKKLSMVCAVLDRNEYLEDPSYQEPPICSPSVHSRCAPEDIDAKLSEVLSIVTIPLREND